MNFNVIDSYDDVRTESAIVRMEKTRKATKRISVDDVKELRHSVMVSEAGDTLRGQRHSVMVSEAEDTLRGQWNHRR